MDVFNLRDHLIGDYASYIKSFIRIADSEIRRHVQSSLESGVLWPDPLIQLNPSFAPGDSITELVKSGILEKECERIFRINKGEAEEQPIRFHKHQSDAIRIAAKRKSYVLTTGTGSGKSLSYIVPIVDRVLKAGSGTGIKAIIVYPMNALVNSQEEELRKFLCEGYPQGKEPVTFQRYTGDVSDEQRQKIVTDPPDIILTNYVMLELILTRPYEKQLIDASKALNFLVFDELHTYRGRQGADVALLIRRLKNRVNSSDLICVGTSATLSTEGEYQDQQREVSELASQIFGAEIREENVVGETLTRLTDEQDETSPTFVSALKKRLEAGSSSPGFESFINDPLSAWIESNLGIKRETKSKRLVRATPLGIDGKSGAGKRLSELTGVGEEICRRQIQAHLLRGYQERNPQTSFPAFAFRVHQFIGRGDTVYSSLEPNDARHITVNKQQFVPDNRDKILLPLVFCRECGQDYFCVRKNHNAERGSKIIEGRELGDKVNDNQSEAGFLFFKDQNGQSWPTEPAAELQKIPEDMLEPYQDTFRVKRSQEKYRPVSIRLGTGGEEDPAGELFFYVPSPFRFCLNCGVTYNPRSRSDFPKLASLSSEGRSTATTILSLSVINNLRKTDLRDKAKKLLSFSDNRQDASLQAGHFNDFIETTILRGALYKAVKESGANGLSHDSLAQAVFEAMSLDMTEYAADPTVKFEARKQTEQALRDVLGYRVYRDLQRGWRIVAPNLEQTGLLEIEYASLNELCEDKETWQTAHPALQSAPVEKRIAAAKVLLDYMRRELAIKVDYLEYERQERIKRASDQRLKSPWALEDEKLEKSQLVFPRSRIRGSNEEPWNAVYLSPRGGFGQFIGRTETLEINEHLRDQDKAQIINDLLEALRSAGLVERLDTGRTTGHAYQINAASMVWKAGTGEKAFHDPIRVPKLPEKGGAVNEFFVKLYRDVALSLVGFLAREHTAQVPGEKREERETQFREGKLPILYCSPTMELGIDIAQLNVVNMRNVPPTPANYAQRSGRAGRSGQPALVFTYCTTGSQHDQYFFRRPQRMVSGVVSAPRIDLANEDLVRSHVQAIWLAETREDLEKSLAQILDVEGAEPTLALLPGKAEQLSWEPAKEMALSRAQAVISTIKGELTESSWFGPEWLPEIVKNAYYNLDKACERWRSLFLAAKKQQQYHNKLATDMSRSEEERKRSQRLRADAEAQLSILTDSKNAFQSDFYSYRYFASEGFLPGYNFPRLPLSAFIPARKVTKGDQEFLSRPRFLAISEFGPRAVIYHEGSRYIINKVILPVDDEDLKTATAKVCSKCGYLHRVRDGAGADICEACDSPLRGAHHDLFRLQNVSTKRHDRIISDEEERLRLGYEITSAVRFAERNNQPSYKQATVRSENASLVQLRYGDAATIWRINLGWKRRANADEHGFLLDLERGFWQSNQEVEDEDTADDLGNRTRRVIPYVEDRRNCLTFELTQEFSDPKEKSAVLASLQAALKNAIQVRYQLEDSELSAEALPDRKNRNLILFYESSEGGAGVLKRLMSSPDELSAVAKEALKLCHFDEGKDWADLGGPEGVDERCEAACYHCLMSYGNQLDHELLDRKKIRDLLVKLALGRAEISSSTDTRGKHLDNLLKLSGSKLEKEWLALLEEHSLHLPTKGQYFIEACNTRPDFFYNNPNAGQYAVYIDGPPHKYPERQKRDVEQQSCLEDSGISVIRFVDESKWLEVIKSYPHVFGALKA